MSDEGQRSGEGVEAPSLKPGQIMICRSPCASCPFGGGPKAVPLRDDRVQEIASAGVFYCHHAVYEKNTAVICSGWDRAFHPNATRVMERLGALVEVNPYQLPVQEGRDRWLDQIGHYDEGEFD